MCAFLVQKGRKIIAAIIFSIAVFAILISGLVLLPIWQHGYGLACTSEELERAPSPDQFFTVSVQRVTCGGLASDSNINIVLQEQSHLFGLLEHSAVLYVYEGNQFDGSNVRVVWQDDNLARITVPFCAATTLEERKPKEICSKSVHNDQRLVVQIISE